jgi:tetratricopeptide (TPR) repeat protein
MQTFGKTMRNSLPALGLGLLTALGMASASFVTAPAAFAQNKAKKEFVENYQAASSALSSRQWSTALAKADAAWPHAANTQQKSVLEQIRVAASCDASIRNHAGCISAIEKAKSTGGLQSSIVKNYDQMLAGRYADSGNGAKALAQTKANIAAYGGTSTELAFVAKKSLEAKNYPEAVTFINKAIAAGKPSATQYNILLNAYQAQGKLDDFYRTVEKIAPIYKTDTYWRMLIERSRKEKNYRSSDAALDVFRALVGAGVKLKSDEQYAMGDAARNRGLSIEAANAWDVLVKANDPLAIKNKGLIDATKATAAKDKATGLAASEATAPTRASGEPFADTAEAYMAAGNYAKAIELFNKGLTKGEMDPGKVELIKVRLGVAQFKGGKKADAVKTWQAIKADNGAAWLAKSWLAIAKS